MSNQRVILYGFGWVGQSVFALCEALGIECLVVDDNLDKSLILNKNLVGIEAIKESSTLCLLTLHERELAQKLRTKLQALGVSDSRLRHISSYDYRQSMAYLLPDFFGSAQSLLALWQSEPFELPQFHTKLMRLVETYHNNKAERNKVSYLFRTQIDSMFSSHCSVFAKMFNMASIKGESPHIHYPGFSVHIELDERADENFYFEKFDWDYVRNRPTDTKLIACFSNCALRLQYLPLQETLTEFLRKDLQACCAKKYIVLNLGISGYTIYEQLMLYNALIYPLAPDLVISFFGGADWRAGYMNCDVMLKEHQIVYSPDYHEYQVKKFIQSISLIKLNSLPLLGEIGTPNPKISGNDINTAIAMRLQQFHDVVCGGGGRFAAFIQPLLPCKKNWTKEEQQMQHNAELMGHISPYQRNLIEHMPQLIFDFKQCFAQSDYIFDLNQVIHESLETLFSYEWIHCNARGNELCAHYVAEVLQQNNYLE